MDGCLKKKKKKIEQKKQKEPETEKGLPGNEIFQHPDITVK